MKMKMTINRRKVNVARVTITPSCTQGSNRTYMDAVMALAIATAGTQRIRISWCKHEENSDADV